MSLLIDEAAREIALSSWALAPCLHVPIAAVDEEAIRNYIGTIERVLSPGSPNRALLVTVPETAAIDPLLPISGQANAGIFYARRQVWVHIAYNRYRHAYRKAFRYCEPGAKPHDEPAYSRPEGLRLRQTYAGVARRKFQQQFFGKVGCRVA